MSLKSDYLEFLAKSKEYNWSWDDIYITEMQMKSVGTEGCVEMYQEYMRQLLPNMHLGYKGCQEILRNTVYLRKC